MKKRMKKRKKKRKKNIKNNYFYKIKMSTNVCTDQATYDAAFQHAVKKYQNTDECTTTRCKTTMAIVYILMLIFCIWAIILAMRVQDKEHRTLHLIFAITMGPIYVICYYSSMLTNYDGSKTISFNL